MTARPILFSAAMVRALLAGDKTQTRRLASSKPMQRVQVGDRLWVREAWNAFAFSQDGEVASPCKTIPTAAEMEEAEELAVRGVPQAVYQESQRAREWFKDQPWRSGIYMPRWASRLTLTVTETRTQPLQWIDDRDARAEGLERVRIDPGCSHWSDAQGGTFAFPRFAYASLWNSLHRAPGTGWDDNPDVIAITFTVSHRNIDA